MKRRDLLAHLAANGCQLVREGARHSWWHSPVTGKRSAIPRHTEVKTIWHAKSAATSVSRNQSGSDARGLHAGARSKTRQVVPKILDVLLVQRA